MMSSIKTTIGIAVVAVITSGLAFYYHGVATQKTDDIKQLNSELEKSRAIISNQAATSRIFNAISEATEHDNHQASAKNATARTEIRTIIKKEPCAMQYLPADVSDRLLGFTHRLRAIAMPTATSEPDHADNRTAAASRLTYAQAVEWLPMLLDAIEQANNRLAAIRAAEKARQPAAIDHNQK
ncbi:DUF2570 domain-containing protein [Chania multitudinisentens]|uniref:DUF2570 domain-containing protein n=1 Tax=Chania multitudinisentens TaxID=1639108 RepID=UPI00046624BC|nr:DUF2570 domain-containing protein [Chania multitudinisentens]